MKSDWLLCLIPLLDAPSAVMVVLYSRAETMTAVKGSHKFQRPITLSELKVYNSKITNSTLSRLLEKGWISRRGKGFILGKEAYLPANS